MNRLSVLIFSRNDIEKAIGLIKDVHGIADDIVLIDSSDRAGRKELLASKRRLGLDRLRIFYVVALGYPDPLRMYGLKKCRHPWVLLIDTDERLSKGLKSNIKNLIVTAKCSAFAIKRYEEVRKGKVTSFFTWQIRLFNKKNTVFKGIVHEQPIIKGRINRLESEGTHIEHLLNQKGKTIFEYTQMEKFERMDYALFNERMLDYLFKLSMPEGGSSQSHRGRLIKGILLAYERLGGKGRDEEISDTDYFIFYFLRSAAFLIKEKNIPGLLRAIPGEWGHKKKIRAQRNAPDGDELFEISKIVNKIGITAFLNLDNERTIAALNRKYSKGDKGIALLMRLLKERYEAKYRK